MKIIKILIFFIALNAQAQKKGCTDIQAQNYDNTAIINDGSCTYAATNYTPKVVCTKLNDTLKESSGLLYFKGMFFTHNDSDNKPEIYAFDSISGKIIHRIFIRNYANKDWEDITQDSLHIYIGDFGNNAGNRNDLKILIINKADLNFKKKIDTVNATAISFNYADQDSFNLKNEDHNFDMEALCVWRDSIHLFSKNWVDNNTKHYVMPKQAGNYTLSPIETMAVGGIITGACTNKIQDKIVLTGYNVKNGACFIHLLWDFKNNLFFNGNKRKIGLGIALTLGQNESVTFKDKQLYLTTEEKYTNAALFRIEIGQWITEKNIGTLLKPNHINQFKVYISNNYLIIKAHPSINEIGFYNFEGKLLVQKQECFGDIMLNIEHLPKGIYTIYINQEWQKFLIE